jgi:hypothetical protein
MRRKIVERKAYLAENDDALPHFSRETARPFVERINATQRIFILDTERMRRPERKHFI